MSGNIAMQLVNEHGWRRGLINLLRSELSSWFGSGRWLMHTLMWVLVINLILLLALIGAEEALEAGEQVSSGAGGMPEAFMLYGIFGGTFVMFGVLVIMQGAIVGEKKSGTAAWVLSKPVSRTSFVISRVIGNAIGIIVTAVLIPGIITYIEFGLLARGGDGLLIGWSSPPSFLAAIFVLSVNMFFWLTLAVMLGTFFESTGAVIAIPLAMIFGQQLLIGKFPVLIYVLPWNLSSPTGDEPSIVASLVYGTAPFSWTPVISVLILSAMFIVVALKRFNRQEF